MSEKVNCWDDRKCGRGLGGGLVSRHGVCPAATDVTCDGVNGGKNAGRLCWAIPNTVCGGKVQISAAEKQATCNVCPFFRRVKYEEGHHFQPTKPGLGEQNAESLHRRLNDASALMMIYRDVFASLAMPALLARIAEQSRTSTSSAGAALYLVDDATGELVLKARAGAVPRPERIDSQADAAAAAAVRTGTLQKADVDLGGCTAPGRVLALPIGGESRPSGVVELVKQEGRFSPDDEWFLREFGLAAGVGIRNATLHESLDRLRNADRTQDRFVAMLMHHIGSPLGTVALSLQALSQLWDRLDAKDRQSLIAASLDRVHVIQTLAGELLNLAAIRSGTYLAHVQWVFPGGILRREVEARRLEAQGRGITLPLEVPETEDLIRADPDGLRLILGNLLDNAIKYSAGKGHEVRACMTAANGAVRISVADQGIGIPSNDLAGIFEKFHRAGNAAASHVPGFGLGLATVKELVDRYGGQIEVASVVDEGTTFTVEFPIAVADGSRAAPEPAVLEPAADEPAADEPAADEPAADEPAADEPAAEAAGGPRRKMMPKHGHS